ncbi:hypothetical protein HCN51_45775 [Nonomuraea sp. FMUSA5-5]|uniref:Uncharacterized protein n=1 Tax=Nonomuraea composti TaxID=2720023 RepID=A0ABX1BIA6_9ACTN|nr:hypothetical protein [Nonomuraea sp. FMUSA5-5]NJP96662.1 hypothetical protein [Nonomuraea sp. FMUSA5-5]
MRAIKRGLGALVVAASMVAGTSVSAVPAANASTAMEYVWKVYDVYKYASACIAVGEVLVQRGDALTYYCAERDDGRFALELLVWET